MSRLCLHTVDGSPRPSGFPSRRSASRTDLLPPVRDGKTSARRSDLHIFPRRLCKIRILASSSSAMVRADCCRCSGAFSAGLSYPFMNAGRVEESQPHCRVTAGPVHTHCCPETFGEISSSRKSPAPCFNLEMVGAFQGI